LKCNEVVKEKNRDVPKKIQHYESIIGPHMVMVHGESQEFFDSSGYVLLVLINFHGFGKQAYNGKDEQDFNKRF
jgi:hypothetical protein